MCSVPRGFYATKYPNEWSMERAECAIVVRAPKDRSPYARCWGANGGEPTDFPRETLEEAFSAALEFQEKMAG